MRKPSIKDRIEVANKIVAKNSVTVSFDVSYSNVKTTLSNALDYVKDTFVGYKDEEIKYELVEVNLDGNLDEYFNQKHGECFFIEFTEDGYVVVVGAGYDYGRPKSEKYLNAKILKDLDKKWSNVAIFCFVTGLKEVEGRSGAGKAGCEHLLQCRNGIEMFLGEALLESGIPILNFYSHKIRRVYKRLFKRSLLTNLVKGLFFYPKGCLKQDNTQKIVVILSLI